MSVEVLDKARDLDALGRIARHEHDAVIGSLVSAVQHAIAAGAALHYAHEQVLPYGEWIVWLRRHGIGETTARVYERLFVYRDQLPVEAFEPYVVKGGNGRTVAPSPERAAAYLRGLPPIRPPGKQLGRRRYPDAVVEEARRLHKNGVTAPAIAELLGVVPGTILNWVDPKSLEKSRRSARASRQRREAALRALERERRSEAARRIGGGVAEVYASVRRALQIIDSEAMVEGLAPATRQRLVGVMRVLYDAEDRVGSILRETEKGAP